MTFESDAAPPPFSPRLSGTNDQPPLNPSAYFLVAFFAGVFSIVYFAYENTTRISQSDSLRTQTFAAGITIVLLYLGLAMFGPVEWIVPNSRFRIMGRVVAVMGSVAFYQLHRGPALSRMLGATNGYESAWKKWLPLLLWGLLQAVVSVAILSVRGLR